MARQGRHFARKVAPARWSWEERRVEVLGWIVVVSMMILLVRGVLGVVRRVVITWVRAVSLVTWWC